MSSWFIDRLILFFHNPVNPIITSSLCIWTHHEIHTKALMYVCNYFLVLGRLQLRNVPTLRWSELDCPLDEKKISGSNTGPRHDVYCIKNWLLTYDEVMFSCHVMFI